jgi:hypothetical protein
MNKDAVIVSISDTHSGSSTALYPGYPMTFKHGEKDAFILSPTKEQKQLYNHWVFCADEVKKLSSGKRKIIVFNGDAIEGVHHGSIQIMSPNINHQNEIHIELMEQFLKRCGFSVKNGDELYYIAGTESHTGWEEHGFKEHFQHLGAQYADDLRLVVNGVVFWYTHHGPNPGKGTNEGNALRNWLRDIYFDCLKSSKSPPDMVITGHFHKSIYGTFNDSYHHTIHGIILPSWQRKTRYAFRVAPFQRNDIGLSRLVVTADGEIRVMKPMLLKD